MPIDTTAGFNVEIVRNVTSFGRMYVAMRPFARDETSVSGYLYHRILGRDLKPQTVKNSSLPGKLSVLNLPFLNESPLVVVLESPLSVIEGLPEPAKLSLPPLLSTTSHDKIIGQPD